MLNVPMKLNQPYLSVTFDRLYECECVEIEEDNSTFQWTMIDSTKTICNYTCQLATTDFRGRTYKAWFTPEIPISAGF